MIWTTRQGYTEDNGVSHWLYDADYAESRLFSRRAAPRTGNQAMHGLFNYSVQETSAVFEANHTYTFSIWAQNDEILNDTNGLFMYIFDGTVHSATPIRCHPSCTQP